MTTFAQALARIEELLDMLSNTVEPFEVCSINTNIKALLGDHADSIVQLGKVAEILRVEVEYYYNSNSQGCFEFDKLMKKE